LFVERGVFISPFPHNAYEANDGLFRLAAFVENVDRDIESRDFHAIF
jgi:hypothetical protein